MINGLQNTLAILSIYFFMLVPQSFAGNTETCQKLFKSRSASHASIASQSMTLSLIDFIENLIVNKKLSTDDLQSFELNLNNNTVINPIPIQLANQNSSIAVLRNRFDSFVALKEQIDLQFLRIWVHRRIVELQQQSNDQERASNKTRNNVTPLKFNFVPHGSYKFIGRDNKMLSEVTLTHDIEVMETLVTQYHWASVMKHNPVFSVYNAVGSIKNPNGPFTEFDFEGVQIKVQPNNPVSCFTWYSAIIFANQLSRHHGYEPVYDLSRVQLAGMIPDRDSQFQRLFTEDDILAAAANGTLRPDTETDDKLLRINAPDGDIYRAKGFRLLTDAEHTYLRLIGGKFESIEEQFEKNMSALHMIAWPIVTNPPGANYPVASLSPQFIGKIPFYDLWGNVYEYTHDYFSVTPLSAINPREPYLGDMGRTGWGFGLYEQANDSQLMTFGPRRRALSFGRDYISSTDNSHNVGIRLGRTLDPK